LRRDGLNDSVHRKGAKDAKKRKESRIDVTEWRIDAAKAA
jgi:hypothetical protein